MKEDILKAYNDLEIKDQNDLYDFILNNRKATINSKNFNFNKSNQTMEFMAIFLTELNFKVVRLFFEKKDSKDKNKKYRHWLLAFSDNNEWFYYEPSLKNYTGKYNFNTYEELTFFISKTLNDYFDNNNLKYSLYEIEPLNTFNFEKNIEQSKNGIEIFATQTIKPKENTNKKNDKKKENKAKKVFEEKQEYIKSLHFFIIAVIITIAICVLVLGITSAIG